MDNFNLKKFLTENKLTHTSHLREGFHSPADPNTVAYNKVKSEWDAGNISDRRYTNMKWMDLPDETQKELYDKYKDDYYEDTMDVDTSGETYDYEMNEVVAATEMTTQETSGHAERFAKYMSDKEGKTFTVTAGSVDGPSFDLDLDGEKYEGGSYLVKDNGDIVNVAITPNKVYGNINQLEEGEAAYEYEKGKEAGEKIEKKKMKENNDIMDFEFQRRQKEKQDKLKAASNSNIDTRDIYDLGTKNKMKVSELKAKIKEMVLAEMNLNISDETPESEEDFLAEIENMLNGVDEAKKDKEEVDTEEATDDITVDDTETIDTTTTTEVDPNVKEVQDALTQAQAAAQKLGDPKLTDQIGNTITFFTRAHIVEKGAVAENLGESENLPINDSRTEQIIQMLKDIDVDGETMEYILRQVGMEDQMANQLVYNPAEYAASLNESMFPMLKK